MTQAERSPRKGFGSYEPGCEEAIYDFQRASYPERAPETILPRWRWLFLDSAARLRVDPMVWLYWKQGRIVAHQGAMPVKLHVAGQELLTGWFIETMAAEEVRGSPIGSMLVQKALSDLPLNLSLGQTAQMRKLQYSLGWQQVAPLNTYLLVCSRHVNLRGKLPPVAAETAAFALALQHTWRLRRHDNVRSRFQARRISRLESRHENLWQQMASATMCAVKRDVSYLNWKYVDRPDADFILLEVSEGGEPVAICVLLLTESSQGYPYPRGFIVDLVAPLDRRAHIDATMAHAVTLLNDLGARTVTFHLTSNVLEPHLLEFGFMRRDPRHQLLISVKGADETTARQLLDPAGWFVTMGDSDADVYTG